MCALSLVLNVVSGKCAEKYDTWDEDLERLLQRKYPEKHDTWDEDIERMNQGFPLKSHRESVSLSIPNAQSKTLNPLDFFVSIAILQKPMPETTSTQDKIMHTQQQPPNYLNWAAPGDYKRETNTRGKRKRELVLTSATNGNTYATEDQTAEKQRKIRIKRKLVKKSDAQDWRRYFAHHQKKKSSS